MMNRNLLIASLIALPLFTAAADRYSESFATPEGDVPSGWLVQKAGNDAVAEIRATENSRVSHALLIERPGPPSTNASVFFTGSTASVKDGQIADLSLTVTLRMSSPRPTNSSSCGVVLRAEEPKQNLFNGYYVAVQASGEQRGLAIYWNPESHVKHGEVVAYSRIERNLPPGRDYQLQITAKGSRIEAELYEVDASGTVGKLVCGVETDEATKVEPGYIGLRGAYGNSGPVGAWFHSLHFTVDGK